MPHVVMSSIDLHAHVFNAAYLPLEGIARFRGINKVLSWIFARLLEAIVEDEELRANSALDRALEELDAQPPASAAEWKARFDQGDDAITLLAEHVSTEVLEANQGEITRGLKELDRLDAEEGIDRAVHPPAAVATPERWDNLEAAELRRGLARLLRRIARRMENGVVVVEWLVLLLRKETTIAKQLVSTFKDTDLFIHHMMDLGPHYDPSGCGYPFVHRQITRVRALTDEFEGKLIPFFAYSPYRADGVDLVKTWLPRGFAGVKFYPPSGYRPTDSRPGDFRKIPQDAVEVNARNHDLFDYCRKQSIPIFAHCQPGEFQQYKGAGCLSHPAGWLDVVREFRDLRLCLGHAGGEGWTAPEGQEDAETAEHCPGMAGFVGAAVQLAVTNDNVYLEFGCMESILDRNGGAAKNLRTRLVHYTELHGAKFGRKIIYGSDWHMLARTPGVGNYHKVFRRIFSDRVLRPYEEDFFTGNALRFLDLRGYLARSDGYLSTKARRNVDDIVARVE